MQHARQGCAGRGKGLPLCQRCILDLVFPFLEVLGGMTGDVADICSRLARQSLAGKEPDHPAGAGIVARRSEPPIAETFVQFGKVIGRGRDGAQRIERIDQATIGGGARHELRDTQRAHRTDRVHLEARLLVDEPCKKSGRHADPLRFALHQGANLPDALSARGVLRQWEVGNG